MHFLRIFDSAIPAEDAPRPRFAVSQHDAKEVVRTFSTATWPALRVELVNVPTDWNGLCRVLNGSLDGFDVLRTWRVTDRGALVECKNGE